MIGIKRLSYCLLPSVESWVNEFAPRRQIILRRYLSSHLFSSSQLRSSFYVSVQDIFSEQYFLQRPSEYTSKPPPYPLSPLPVSRDRLGIGCRNREQSLPHDCGCLFPRKLPSCSFAAASILSVYRVTPMSSPILFLVAARHTLWRG